MAQRKIRNTLTGEIKVIDDAELGSYGLAPQTSTADMTFADDTPAIQTQKTPTPTPTMSTQTKTPAPTSDMNPMQMQYQQAWKNAPTLKDQAAIADGWAKAQGYELFGTKPLTEEEKAALKQENITLKGAPATDVNLLRNVITSSQTASKEYNPKYTGFLDSLVGKFRTTFGGDKNQPEAEFRSDIADIRTAIRNYISGAAIPQAEAKEFEDLIPNVSDSDVQIRAKLKKLQERSIGKVENVLATAGYDKTGKEYLGTDVIPTANPEQGPTKNSLYEGIKNNPVSNFMIGTSADIAQDSGAGITARGQIPQLQEAENQAKMLEQKAMTATNPEEKKRLLQQANELRKRISTGAQGLSQSFSDSVEDSNLWRAPMAGLEIAGTAEAPALIKGGIGAVRNIPNMVRGIGSKVVPTQAGIGLRNSVVNIAEEAGKQIDGNVVVNGMSEWAQKAARANPGKSSQIKKIADEVTQLYKNKKISPQEAFDIWHQIDSGFTQSGITKTTVEASSDRAMRDVFRQVLDEVAPGFEEGTKMIRQGKQAQKGVDYVKNKAVDAVVGTGSLIAALKLYDALGFNNNKD